MAFKRRSKKEASQREQKNHTKPMNSEIQKTLYEFFNILKLKLINNHQEENITLQLCKLVQDY